MTTPRALPQSKETLLQNYNKRLKDDVRSIVDNFSEIIKTAKVNKRLLGYLSVSLLFRVQDLSYLFDILPPFLQIEDETQVSRATQGEQDHYEMHVRAANIVSIVIWQSRELKEGRRWLKKPTTILIISSGASGRVPDEASLGPEAVPHPERLPFSQRRHHPAEPAAPLAAGRV